MSREGVFWGWGEAGAGPSLPGHAAGVLRSALGVEGAVVSRPVALADVRLRAPAAAAASPTSTCCASARATARTRRTPWWRRATRARPST